MRRRVIASVCIAACVAAFAQDVPPPPATEKPVSEMQATYLPADFARFAPRNALDMLNRVPGFVLRVANDDARGLGQAGDNVVVNGERLSSKSESVNAQLTRIAASRVVRIDLIDGATLGIPGLSGQVANLIVSAGVTSGRFEYRATARPKYAKPSFGAGGISINGSQSNLEWTLAFAHDANRGAAGGGAYVVDGNGTVTEEREVLLRAGGEFPRLTGSATWKLGSDTTVKGSATYRRIDNDFLTREQRFPVTGADLLRDFRNTNRGYEWELSSELETGLPAGRLKLIALTSSTPSHRRSVALLLDAQTLEGTGTRYTAQTDAYEHIGRGEYRWRMLGGDWELDGEMAFNGLDQSAQLYEVGTNGSLTPLPFPQGTGGVKERRYESILTFGRSLSRRLNFQIGAGYEYSELKQDGAGGLTRDFWRPKGSLNLAWSSGGAIDASLNLTRRVGQLSFGDFLGSVLLERENRNAGNAELVPEQSWDLNLELTGKLGQLATTTLRTYGRWVEDYVDVIPLPGGLESPGNIDSARLRGVEWRSTVTTDGLGWRGARIDTTLKFEKTMVRDPLTQTRRSTSNHVDRIARIALRHDVPGGQWAWGGGVEYTHKLAYYRLAETGRDYEGPAYTFGFVEHKDVFGLTVNLQVFNLTDGRAILHRTVYAGARNATQPLFIERRDLSVQPIFRLQVTGSF